jgi:hypothetical protein
MSNRCLVVPKWAEVLEIEGRGRLGVDPKYGNFCSGVRRGLFSDSALFEPGFGGVDSKYGRGARDVRTVPGIKSRVLAHCGA